MTDEQRDKGRAITLALLVMMMLIGMCSSCSNSLYRSNQIKVTHVLAVTELGDTVKIAMRDIQPTQMYNVIGYDFVRGYNNPYYDPWRQYHIYDNYYRYYGDHTSFWQEHRYYNNTNYSNKTWKPISTPQGSNNIFSSGNSGGSNTTGGGSNPVAINPVTSGGGIKKNN